jgi:hypothetical protein
MEIPKRATALGMAISVRLTERNVGAAGDVDYASGGGAGFADASSIDRV